MTLSVPMFQPMPFFTNPNERMLRAGRFHYKQPCGDGLVVLCRVSGTVLPPIRMKNYMSARVHCLSSMIVHRQRVVMFVTELQDQM